MAQQINMNVPLDQLKDRVCDKCGCKPTAPEGPVEIETINFFGVFLLPGKGRDHD